MDGVNISAGASYGALSTTWKLATTHDYNGDNKSDFVWRNSSTGDTAIWLMNGLSISQANSFNMPLAWKIIGGNNDVRKDKAPAQSVQSTRNPQDVVNAVQAKGLPFASMGISAYPTALQANFSPYFPQPAMSSSFAMPHSFAENLDLRK